jgi:nucleoside-diphosphate-sugar epimerase
MVLLRKLSARNMKGKQVCVTGANGFIGRHLVYALSQQGYSIRVLTRRPDCLFPSGVQVVVGDLTTPGCPLDQFLEGCEIVFHCAGEIRDVAAMQLLHVGGTQHLLQAVLKVPTKTEQKIHWVQLSSVGVYGPSFGPAKTYHLVTEDTQLRPVGEYEITKARADELVVQASDGVKMTYSIVRPSNVFGIGMPNQSLRGLISMVKRGLFFYIGKPGAVAPYVHVDDVVAALLKCAFEPKARGQTYNLSNDCLLEDLIKCIASLLGVRSPRIRIPESLIRIAVGLFEGRLNIPLTQSRIDALVNKTRYPADKIVSELGFKFSMPITAAIEVLVNEAGA